MDRIKGLFLCLLSVAALVSPAFCGVPIPVYPGSVMDIDQSGDAECCDFSTADSIAKVSTFYEKAFKSQAMTIDEAAKRYPALAEGLAKLKKQIPAGVQYRALAIPSAEGQKEEAPQLFELLGAAGLVNYTISEESLAGADQSYSSEFRSRTGKLNSDEKAAAQRKEVEKTIQAELAKEDGLWKKTLKTNGVALYPDAEYLRSEGPKSPESGGDTGSPLILGIYETYGLYEKVRDFYSAKMSLVSEETIPTRRQVSPFRYGTAAGERAYTSKSRAGQGRSYFAGSGCVDVAIIEGRGGENGQKITRILFDYDPKCKEAEVIVKALWPE